jgi:hypothetical protein
MSTTPRDSGYATAIVPLLGGFREFAAAADPDESGPPIRAEAPRPATLLAASENGAAAMKPAADLLSNSLRFIATDPAVFLYWCEAYSVTRIRNVKGLSIYGVFSFDQISAASSPVENCWCKGDVTPTESAGDSDLWCPEAIRTAKPQWGPDARHGRRVPSRSPTLRQRG